MWSINLGYKLVRKRIWELSSKSFHLHTLSEKTSTHASWKFSRPIHYNSSLRAVIQHTAQNKEILANILGVKPDDVKKYSKKLMNKDSATAAMEILQENNITPQAILRSPDSLMMTPLSIKNYIEIMKETGFKHITLRMITNFRNVHKQTLKHLREKFFIPTHHEIVHNYCRILEIENSETENAIWESLPQDFDRLTLVELRRQVITHYLCLVLNATPDDFKTVFNKQKRLDYRCLKSVKQSISLFLNEFEFPKEKILKHLYLLHANPDNTLQIFQEISSLSDIPLKELVQSRPKILMSLCSSLLEIENLFRQHEIPNVSIMKYPEIYTLSPTTVKERLEELDTIPEFHPLKRHPRVARLLYYQTKAKARLEQMRSLQLSGSLHLLSSDAKRFKQLLLLGEMKNKGSDLLKYLSTYFENIASASEVRKSLLRQPNWLHFSLVNVKECLQFIESFKIFSKAQILSALPICLYPKDKIQQEFDNAISSKEAKLTDEFFLHMVLYFLERDVHFSGDGVWHSNKPPSHDDDDEQHHLSESDIITTKSESASMK